MKALFERGLDFLLPAGCISCRSWIRDPEREGLVCGTCRTRMRTPSWPRCPRCHAPTGSGAPAQPDCLECAEWPAELKKARYAYELAHPVDDLVHALKYEGWRELAPLMGTAIVEILRQEARDATGAALRPKAVVVPVPTTARRQKRRGYCQATLLAEVVAQALDTPLLPLLERTGRRPSQTSLSPHDRGANVRGVFALRGGLEAIAEGTLILLVDDVLTTGSTASEAARTLARDSSVEVVLGTFARAMPDPLERRRDRGIS